VKLCNPDVSISDMVIIMDKITFRNKNTPAILFLLFLTGCKVFKHPTSAQQALQWNFIATLRKRVRKQLISNSFQLFFRADKKPWVKPRVSG
ncbi:MAG TPA: hypothetical protein VNU93_04320, partial [Verrucomicrobiae bacterium]|nr:hypothetical protein [Verrucomicrobiae bacterium]